MRTANFGSNLDACLLSHLRECHHFVWYIYLCILEFLLTFCLVLNWTFWSHACYALRLPRDNTIVGRVFELLVMMGRGSKWKYVVAVVNHSYMNCYIGFPKTFKDVRTNWRTFLTFSHGPYFQIAGNLQIIPFPTFKTENQTTRPSWRK